MEFYQAVNNRRVVRDLREEPVAEDILERMIAAGMQAPTHNHQRMWEFVVLREREEKENASKGYMLPCYIGLGYPVDGCEELEQIRRDVKSVMHFGKW